MMEHTTTFMTWFVSGSLLLLTVAVFCLISGLRKNEKPLVFTSVFLFLLLVGAWFLLAYFLTRR